VEPEYVDQSGASPGTSVQEFMNKSGHEEIVDASLRKLQFERHGGAHPDDEYLEGGRLPGGSDSSDAFQAYAEEAVKSAQRSQSAAASIQRKEHQLGKRVRSDQLVDYLGSVRPYAYGAVKGAVPGGLIAGFMTNSPKAKTLGAGIGAGLGLADTFLRRQAAKRFSRRPSTVKLGMPSATSVHSVAVLVKEAYNPTSPGNALMSKMRASKRPHEHKGVTTDKMLRGGGPSIKAYVAGLKGQTTMPSPMPNRHD
tara:strand:+ start:214 stop:972 length:759 start_codon:yes stop_codon:yes gene_type:complete